MREYFVHRSLYHLKEGDPHSCTIPRLTGPAKASFVAVEFDEYGGGLGHRVHQQLFADLLDAADLDSTYLGYLDNVPADSLAVVNLMSMFGLHRWIAWCGRRTFRVDRDHLAARLGADGRCSAADARALGLRRLLPRARRGRCGSRTGRATDVVGDLVAREPTWTAISCSVCARTTSSRTGSLRT